MAAQDGNLAKARLQLKMPHPQADAGGERGRRSGAVRWPSPETLLSAGKEARTCDRGGYAEAAIIPFSGYGLTVS
jgi:hypothetical protein